MSMPDSAEQKAVLRKEALHLRDGLRPEERAAKSSEIVRRIQAHPAYQAAETVLYYMPIRSEVDVLPLLCEGLLQLKRCLLPKCIENYRLELRQIFNAERDTRLGMFGIREPGENSVLYADEVISAIIIPGAAYDEAGRRIGYGKGYYDRLLSRLRKRAVTIAPAFDCQVLRGVQTDPCDVPVDFIATESRLLDCRKLRG
jgi:5-formyltetrahydrofolate cyclo-ligase